MKPYEIDEWFFEKLDGCRNHLPWSILSRVWFVSTNFINILHSRILERGICALKGCDIHYCCGWNLPEDGCEWYCKRCGAEGINHIVYIYEIFYSDRKLRNFIAALRGQ